MIIPRLRRIWLFTHRWLGLTAGLLFVLVGLSGSLLVFHHAIDEWLNPQLLLVSDSGPRRTLTEVVAAAQSTLGDQPAKVAFVEPPGAEHGVWTVWFRTSSRPEARFSQVYVNPRTAEVIGQRVRGEYLTTWVYELHTRLLAGPTGETIVGLSGILLLISVSTGIILWWPLWKHSWRAAVALRPGRRFSYDLHKNIGLVSAAVLVVLSLTGVYLVFPKWIKPGVLAISAETVPPPSALRSTVVEGASSIDPDRALAIAQNTLPDGECKRLHLPTRKDGVYIARVRQPGDVRRSLGNSRVWIDQYSGKVLAVRDWHQRTGADTFFAWQFPLHNGEAFGLAGRWLVFVTGLTPAGLYFTGCLLWWRRRRSRRRQLRR